MFDSFWTCHTCTPFSCGKGSAMPDCIGKQKMWKILLVYWPTSWCCSSSILPLLCPRPSCYRTESCTRPELVRTGKALFPVCSYRHCHITLPHSHCECHCHQKPPNYARCTKNHLKKNNLQRCQSPQPSTTIPLVTSRRTGKSPVLMPLLMTKLTDLGKLILKFLPNVAIAYNQECYNASLPIMNTLPFSAINILHVNGSLNSVLVDMHYVSTICKIYTNCGSYTYSLN